MEDMVAMLHHPQLYASRCNQSMTSSYGWRAGGCGGSAIAQRIEDDLLHGGRSCAFTHMPATMEHKSNTTPGIGRLAGHGLASHLPGFDKEAAHKGREKLFKVSRSYSVLSTPSMLDLTPISIPPTDVSGFVDVSLSECRNSITKPVKLNPWVRSESEGATHGISHKEGAAGEYFPQRMIGAGASKLELIKKNVASPRLDGNQVQEGIAAATSPSTMKEAIERAALKIKLAKQARDGTKEREMESSNTTKSRDYRKQNKKAYEEEDREREAYDKCEIHRRKQQGSESRETEDRECLYRGRDIGRERGREREKHREDSEWVTWDTQEGRDCIHEGPERLATTVQKRVNSIVRPTAETPAQVAAEQKRATLGEPMAESDKQAQHEAVHKITKEAREGALLRTKVERAAANARERAERVVAAVIKQQQSKENDASSLIMRNSQTRSFSKQKDGSQNLWPENRKPSNERQEQGSFAGEFGANRKVFVTSTADAQTLLFNTGKFQEVDGETPECHSTRWECHQHMQERVAKALQEKNQRDLQNEMEQAERHRASEMLDPSIKHWAAGKEGNLHVLLSNLHLILWPECGWQPISMIDLITTESVKKAYRKATLCVHPDKLQQKGATIQQKYMAEKIFDLLKDAWNKFQS